MRYKREFSLQLLGGMSMASLHSAQAVSAAVEKFQFPGYEVPSKYLAVHYYCSGRDFPGIMIT